jgi:REP element-mobilizing transposase RayT
MAKKTQYSIFEQKPKRGRKPQKPHDHFGGMYLKNYNPKSKRPMDSKKALHVVLRSTKATGARSFKNEKYEARIWEIVSQHAKNTGVRIYEYANSGNHLHLLIRAKTRADYNTFMRTITGLIARLVGRSERGKPLKEKFWDGRPFSRVVSFSPKEFKAAKNYLNRNNLESIGWLPYVARDKRLPAELREWLATSVTSG